MSTTVKAAVAAMLQFQSAQHVRPLNYIAEEIYRDWSKQGKGVNYAAKPYLEAMQQLDSIKGRFYEDSAESVVAYFLGNASSWRGEVAKRVKKELNDMLKGAR